MLRLTDALPDLFDKEWWYVKGTEARHGFIKSIHSTGLCIGDSDVIRPPYVLYDTESEARSACRAAATKTG